MFPTPATSCWFISAAFTEPFLPSKRSRKEAQSSSRESGPSFFFRTNSSRSSTRCTLPNIRWSSKARWYPLSKEIRNLSCGGSRSRSSKYLRSPVMPKCMSSQPPLSSPTKRFLPWRRVDSNLRPFRVLCSLRAETPPRILPLRTSTNSIFWCSEVEFTYRLKTSTSGSSGIRISPYLPQDHFHAVVRDFGSDSAFVGHLLDSGDQGRLVAGDEFRAAMGEDRTRH